MSLKVNKV